MNTKKPLKRLTRDEMLERERENRVSAEMQEKIAHALNEASENVLKQLGYELPENPTQEDLDAMKATLAKDGIVISHRRVASGPDRLRYQIIVQQVACHVDLELEDFERGD